MNEYEQDLEDIMLDMLDPIVIYSVLVKFWDDTAQLFTFEFEEYQKDFIEYCREQFDGMGIREMIMFESLLNYRVEDYEMFREAH